MRFTSKFGFAELVIRFAKPFVNLTQANSPNAADHLCANYKRKPPADKPMAITVFTF